jgi:hypothetical protein
MNCKQCKKYQHSCSSCGLVDWEWDFCTETCKDKYQNKFKVLVKDFWDSLSEEQQDMFDTIIEDEYVLEILTEFKF